MPSIGNMFQVMVAPLNRSGSSPSDSVRLRPATAAISANAWVRDLQSRRSRDDTLPRSMPLAWCVVCERDQASGVAKRQRPDRDGVDDAEDGAVDADAERQAGNGQRGEPGVLDERPGRVAQILQECVHKALRRGRPIRSSINLDSPRSTRRRSARLSPYRSCLPRRCSPAAMMARIEGAQSPDRQGLDRLTCSRSWTGFTSRA